MQNLPSEKVQMFGTVVGVDREKGVVVELAGSRTGERYTLPPDTRAFDAAKPGEYVLHSTGETVVDPDFVTTWVTTRGWDA